MQFSIVWSYSHKLILLQWLLLTVSFRRICLHYLKLLALLLVKLCLVIFMQFLDILPKSPTPPPPLLAHVSFLQHQWHIAISLIILANLQFHLFCPGQVVNKFSMKPFSYLYNVPFKSFPLLPMLNV